MMNRFQRSARFALFALLVASGLSSPKAQAQNCEGDGGCGFMSCKTPARPNPQALWGELQPTDVGTIAPARDNTDFNEFTSSYGVGNPLWMSLDIDSGYMYSVISHGFQIWDVRANPGNPTSIKTIAAPSTFLFWPQGELKVPLRDIDVDGTLGAVAGQSDIGITIWDFADRNTPKLLYQNSGYIGNQVYTTTLGGQQYAFLATEASGAHPASRPGGLLVYNMTRAKVVAPTVPCLDDFLGSCPGVYVGKVAARTQVRYVDGVDNFVALGTGPLASVEIWDVSNPSSPSQRLSGLSSVYGVAMWKSGSKYYLAVRTDFAGSIYDVSCIASGPCSLGSPVWTQSLPGGTEEYYVTYSKSGSRSFLYFGSDNTCGGNPPDPQREFLIDVSVPSQAHDITPTQKITVGGLQIGYWDYYYRKNPTGFNRVMPRMGKFEGEYFYRAAQSILDIHKLTGGVAPTVDFDWSPANVYPGTAVSFTDQSTGTPNSWTWTFQPDGTPSGSSVQNPTGVSFGSTGAKTISLTASNAAGNGSRSKTLTVLDPAPAIASVSLSPLNPIVCQPVTFSATGVTGQPTLTYSWQVTPRPSGPPVTTSTSPSFTWNTTGILAGDFTATLQVQNSISSATRSVDFTLGALSPLPSVFAPTNDPFAAGTVQFHVVAAGATEWSWDFGDGAGFGPYSNDPVTGPNPTYTYSTLGPKVVQVKVRNCVEAERTSSPLAITILVTSPLLANFAAVNGSGVFCFGGGCLGTVGTPIAFTDDSDGAQFYDYDWDANGSYEEANRTTPQTTHTYTAEGSFFPKLRVRRGTEEKVFTHALPIIISGTITPVSISISGSSSANINQAVTLTASASGCNPASSGWTWSAGGGTFNGASNASSVSITWTTTGSKTVTATNSACTGATGTRQVTVTDPGSGGGGGTLAALFTFSPSNPTVGQSVSFNGAGSTGSPTGYAWDFGDGQNASGSTAAHSFAVAGNYSVRLTVTKPGTGPGCLFGTCVSEKVMAVVVTGTPPPTFEVNFTTSASCITQFGIELCEGDTGVPINFTSTSVGASNLTWSFGDGTPGTTGATAVHTYGQAGSYTVSLTGTNGSQTKTKTRVFQITGTPTVEGKSVILPWIAQTRGVVTQSSDLYVFNPGDQPIKVDLKFLKRGAVEANPPLQTRDIAAGATLFVGDVLGQLFARENTVGFITAVVKEGNADPVVLSFNNTLQTDGSKFGQTVPGVQMTDTSASAGALDPMYLIGLNDNSERVAYFGLSNPNPEPAVYVVRLFDAQGQQIGQSADLTLGRFGQKQFQPQEIRDLGVSNATDYRVAIEPKSGGRIYPYGTNLRVATQDPAFASSEAPTGKKLFLVGSLSQPGLNNSLYRTDVVLANPFAQALAVDISFTAVGVSSLPQTPVRVTLQPGESQRLANVIADKWGITNQVGFLSFASSTSDGLLPRLTGESYDNANPARRFGQSMIPQSDKDAASVRQGQVLVGLRQGSAWRTTIWVMNPSVEQGLYDVIYRKLDGTILGRFTSLPLGPGKMKQIRPSEHPLGGLAIEDGFTVQVLVKGGKALAAAQVINNQTNDPAYIRGETR